MAAPATGPSHTASHQSGRALLATRPFRHEASACCS